MMGHWFLVENTNPTYHACDVKEMTFVDEKSIWVTIFGLELNRK